MLSSYVNPNPSILSSRRPRISVRKGRFQVSGAEAGARDSGRGSERADVAPVLRSAHAGLTSGATIMPAIMAVVSRDVLRIKAVSYA